MLAVSASATNMLTSSVSTRLPLCGEDIDLATEPKAG
jgi:hypothetical protein